MYTKKLETKIDDRLLAAHISDNAEFEEACLSGNAGKIMAIVEAEMEKNKLFTKGSKKLRDDIFKKLRGQDKVSYIVGASILSFVWNSRMAGNGLAVN
jgi:hypothetical protein